MDILDITQQITVRLGRTL